MEAGLVEVDDPEATCRANDEVTGVSIGEADSQFVQSPPEVADLLSQLLGHSLPLMCFLR